MEARRLVLREKALFLSISRSDKGVYLRSVELHDQLTFENPFVGVAVRSMLYEAACDEPVTPEWNTYKMAVNSYLAYLCGLTVIRSEMPLARLPRCATMADRHHIIMSAVRAVFEDAAEDMPYWRDVAFRDRLIPNTFSFAPFTTTPTPRPRGNAPLFPDQDMTQ